MQMRQAPAGIIWCPVDTVHKVKFLSSSTCQSDCGIKQTSDLLCRYFIYRSHRLLLTISDKIGWPVSNPISCLFLKLRTEPKKRLIIALRSIVLKGLLCIFTRVFWFVVEFVGGFVGFQFSSNIFSWDYYYWKRFKIIWIKRNTRCDLALFFYGCFFSLFFFLKQFTVWENISPFIAVKLMVLIWVTHEFNWIKWACVCILAVYLQTSFFVCCCCCWLNLDTVCGHELSLSN